MTETTNENRLIFVGGAPRSGTTLVQNMLDSHPLILGGPEFLHLPKVIELRKTLHASISKGWIDIICSKEDVDNHLRSMIESLFLRLADKRQARFYSEKSPMNILAFSELIELFPHSRFIHVVRDPRAIIASMKKVRQRAVGKGLNTPYFTRSVNASIAYVKSCFDAGFAAAERYPRHVLTVVFEDLLKDPEIYTRRISDFLGIAWSEAMLHPGEKEHIGEQAITRNSGEIWYNVTEYYRNPDATIVEKWKDSLTAREQIRIIKAFGKREDLRACGYRLALDSISQVNRWLARGYFVYLLCGSSLQRSCAALLRKTPGFSSLKRWVLAIVQ